MQMPTLETQRLVIRPLTLDDLDAVYQLLDVDLREADVGTEGALEREGRRRWLEWTVLNYQQLALQYQPPYGDRAVVLKERDELIGLCGYVPGFGPFAQIPALGGATPDGTTRFTPEFGLYWAISPAHRRRGYAGEAAQALIDYGFAQLNLQRIIATTTYDNTASIGVMRRVGMQIERNPLPTPPWFQIVGVRTYAEQL